MNAPATSQFVEEAVQFAIGQSDFEQQNVQHYVRIITDEFATGHIAVDSVKPQAVLYTRSVTDCPRLHKLLNDIALAIAIISITTSVCQPDITKWPRRCQFAFRLWSMVMVPILPMLLCPVYS